ncbi:MAG: hypothetical protein H7X83_12930 [Verrucomicrobia bacterium]|nr:hypothetical protein [Deltaproteobacteria bacterium]
MKKLLLAATATLAMASISLPAASSTTLVTPGEEHCVVDVATWDRLNIRSRPSSRAPVVSRKRYGSCGILVVGSCRAQWCRVEDGHSVGWVNRRFLSMVSPALYCAKGARVNVRAYPSSKSRVLVALNAHTCEIAFLPYSRSNWQKIRVQGWEGWVKRTSVSGQ